MPVSLQRLRTCYLDALKRVVAERETQGVTVATEVGFMIPDSRRHDLYRRFVVDLWCKQDDGSAEAHFVDVSPLPVAWPDLPAVSKLAWNSIVFRCSGASFPEERLIEWGMRWIDDGAPPMGPQDGLTGIIHLVSQPQAIAGGVEFEVDFGSAPHLALGELIQILDGRIEGVRTACD